MNSVVVEAAVDVKRAAEDVFDYCSDPSREPDWNPMMKRIIQITDGPIGVGTRYEAKFAKGPPMIVECVGYDPPAVWAFKGESRALRARSGGRVAPISEGARLVMRMELEPRGLGKLAMPLLRRRMSAMWQMELDNIKARLEAGERVGW